MGRTTWGEGRSPAAALRSLLSTTGADGRAATAEEIRSFLPWMVLRAGVTVVGDLPGQVQADLLDALNRAGITEAHDADEIERRVEAYYARHPVRDDLRRGFESIVRSQSATRGGGMDLELTAAALFGEVGRALSPPDAPVPEGAIRGALNAQISLLVAGNAATGVAPKNRTRRGMRRRRARPC